MGKPVFTSGSFGSFCLLGLFLFLAPGSGAQFYNQGADPGSLKWEQIRTDHFRVIYPVDFQDEARRMTHILESYYEPNSACMQHRPAPIPVILHNYSVLSNGFVALAPKRMELVTTPSPLSLSQDHFEQLALHEFRHVMQVDMVRQGFTRGLSWIFGQAGTGAVTGLMPFWYLEGDATDAETRLSHSGRGRLPSFEMEIKAILAEKPGLWPYEKAVFGSYRDYVPDHYRYGYQMVAQARNKYGNELWENLVSFTGRKPYTLYPYYFGLKKYAGLSKTDLYRETFEMLRAHWAETAAEREFTDMERINRERKKYYTSYRFPRYINDTLIFAEKSGIDQITEFVAIDRQGNETRIHRPGFYEAANISVARGRIVWAEILQDVRWERRSYSVIKIYDMERKSEKILRLKTRYFAPDISEDGLFITAIEADEQNRYFLLVLNANTGDIVVREESPGNRYLQYPVWNDDKSRIYMTSLGEEGKSIVYYQINGGEWGMVFEAGYEDIAELDCHGKTLVFRGGFSGIDNIYALNLENFDCQMVTSSRFGAFYPCLSANGDTLIYADYTSQGYDIVRTAFKPYGHVPLEAVKGHREQLNLPSEADESRVPVPGSSVPLYESRKYRKLGNLFTFHSWAPLYVDVSDPSIEQLPASPGLMLLSQNLLSTATTILGYEYNMQQRDHFLHASFTWSGWFPVLKFSLDYGGLTQVASPPDSVSAPAEVHTDLSLRTKVHLPLNFTYNRYVMGAQPSVEASYSRAYFYYTEPGTYRSGLTFMDYRLYFYSYLKTSQRDILPRLGLVLNLRYVDTPFESEQLGSERLGSGTLYLPGVLRHQTLKVFGGIQKQDPAHYLMGNLMSMPRGIFNHTATELRKISLDYVFPIACPDWQVWRVAYFKRFRGSVFYDFAAGRGVNIHGNRNGPVDRNFQSLGLELTTDMHLAQIFLPFNIGGRFIWIPATGQTAGEFIFSVDLSQF
jgi:hypothetical protein